MVCEAKERAPGKTLKPACMAEREGFEPSIRYQRIHDFQSCAFDQLSHLSKVYFIFNSEYHFTPSKHSCQLPVFKIG